MYPMREIVHHFGSGVYIKEMSLRNGQFAETHSHVYDHFGMLGSGRAAIEVDGSVNVYDGPKVVLIEKGKPHRITALSDISWFCIHATEETDPNKVDEVLVKGE